VYVDQNERTYPVDAGMLGVVQAQEGDPTPREFLTNTVTFPHAFDVTYDEGMVTIGHIKINTNPED
jgi:hypothetical protein